MAVTIAHCPCKKQATKTHLDSGLQRRLKKEKKGRDEK